MRIGWVGTGVMGASMAGHVQRAGHSLAVYNRTKSKAQALLDAGATWCETPAAVAGISEILFSIVGFPHDVEATYLAPDGVLTVSGPCRIIVDMTTSQPSLARRLAEEAARRGVVSLDAPVSGGDSGARNATLAIMVGGSQAAFEEVLPLFRVMGQNVVRMGGPGAGQHTKMCNQILIAGTMIGVCEGLLYAARSGLDQQAIIDIIGKGAAGSWSINNLGPRIVKGDFAPGFVVDHFIKDMEIALGEARAMGLKLPGLMLVHQLYLAVKADGHGRSGTHALILALQKLSGQRPQTEKLK